MAGASAAKEFVEGLCTNKSRMCEGFESDDSQEEALSSTARWKHAKKKLLPVLQIWGSEKGPLKVQNIAKT